jgi:hypothetical protein
MTKLMGGDKEDESVYGKNEVPWKLSGSCQLTAMKEANGKS